ncbi:cell division protein ZipA C-terminal FtsZ-binding domain-containing protein [Marinobacterium sp. LSUCC0821]|uniref:cell division protein ZipA C-terminal FtsZ-binding domain-containing protein n=1 Tax=Marinobacterium sp. LSUCC0821 TaxID=2668067 RepID=UPI0014522963|nr:cell division protein ZipA C-terminal FtsZ-binding domain-containing protein [Marinobacterium sp. LSUCC0821]QJD71465.1 hypothetical protein HH196_07010 [Marinobacterium sp. LSUCC0821]
MDLREWLIVAGVVLVVLILVDGWRRVGGRSNRIKMKIDRSFEGSAEVEEKEDKNNPELPNGGARLKREVDRPDIDQLIAEEAKNSPVQSERIEPSFAPIDELLPDPFERFGESESDIIDTLSDEGVVSKPRKSSAKPAETSKADEGSESVLKEEPLENPSEDQPEEEVSIEAEVEGSLEVEDSLEIEDSVETDVSAQATTADESLSEAASELEPELEKTVQPEPVLERDLEQELEQEPVQEPEPETSESESQSEEKPEPAPGHVEDLFGLDLDRPIHELMDASSKSTKKKRTTKSSRAKQVEEESSAAFDELLEPRPESVDEPLDDIDSLVAETATVELEESLESTADADAADTVVDAESTESGSVRKPRKLDMTDPESTLVLFVVAPEGQAMSGQHLKTVVEKCGMEFGQMGLFHRFEDNSDSSPIQFSMSSVSGSGAFDLETIDAQEMRAVTFFMSMSEPRDPSYAVECMLATAATLSKALGCEMLDNDRSVMRPQTQEHYRELVKAFKLKERAKSRRTRKTK